MKSWHRFTLAIVFGLAAGTSLAVYRVRGGLAAGQIVNGPWATARTYGTANASALVRAQVALSGLLALPAREAMYFTARTDSAGRPLNGRCSYQVYGPNIAARWWSVTVYDTHGYLRPNVLENYSVGSARLFPTKPADNSSEIAFWFYVDETGLDEHYTAVSSGGDGAFELTLRAYHPSQRLLSNPEQARLPTIHRDSCK